MSLSSLARGSIVSSRCNANLGSPILGTRTFSHSSRLFATQVDNHYETLGVSKSSSRKEIRNKFYELSRKFHPDAPSTSSSVSEEARTAKFKAISESYSILSDDALRRQYDATLSGYSAYGRPRYTSGAAHEVSRSGFGGGAARGDGAAWSSAENEARRERANYAWQHPNRHRASQRSAADAARARSNPFGASSGTTPGGGNGATADDHFQTFAAREARARQRAEANAQSRRASGGAPGSRFSSGTAVFGEKAEEENRLINDSSTKRSAQVFFVFAATFGLAAMFSRSGNSEKDRRR